MPGIHMASEYSHVWLRRSPSSPHGILAGDCKQASETDGFVKGYHLDESAVAGGLYFLASAMPIRGPEGFVSHAPSSSPRSQLRDFWPLGMQHRMLW